MSPIKFINNKDLHDTTDDYIESPARLMTQKFFNNEKEPCKPKLIHPLAINVLMSPKSSFVNIPQQS